MKHPLFHSITQPIDLLCQKISATASWLNIIIMLIILLDVIFRRFFNVGSVSLQELEWHCYLILILTTCAYTLQLDQHVRIDIFYNRFSIRSKAWVDSLGIIFLLLPLCGLIGWLSLDFVARAWSLQEVSDAPGGLPMRWLIKSVIPLAMGLLFIQGISQLLKNIDLLLSKTKS
ncbi:MAG: TRAP transporter small permease subunit [Methylococcales bacterium]|jgi:TRAP-type mannitol/chloroaromatic compound transport system permease small subunit|nr:TRAP transporter small permease subunit [Methylococcales bacterium]MBT7409824.1 TRAP transporter small permease subunit [Methylococcales bacterium]